MRIRSFAAAVVLVSSAVLFGGSAAIADSPETVNIVAHPCTFGPPHEAGIWSASGATSDHGTYIQTEVASSPPNAQIFQNETAREEFSFFGSLGMFMIHTEERTGPPPQIVWQLEPGTGAYMDASGHGDASFSFVPPVAFCLSSLTLVGVMGKVSTG